MLADRTKSLSIIAYAQGLVTMIDFVFTLVGFLVALASPDTFSQTLAVRVNTYLPFKYLIF